MAFTDSAAQTGPPPGLGAGGGPPGGGPPGGGGPEGGGLLEALQAQRGGAPNSMPGAGSQAKAMTTIMNAVQMIHAALNDLNPMDRTTMDIRRSVDRITKHLPQGNATAGAQKTDFMDGLRTVAQTALSQNLPQGGQNPQPSTPLPGA